MLLKTVTTPTPTTYLHYTSPVCMNQRVQGKYKATPTRTTALGVTRATRAAQQAAGLKSTTQHMHVVLPGVYRPCVCVTMLSEVSPSPVIQPPVLLLLAHVIFLSKVVTFTEYVEAVKE